MRYRVLKRVAYQGNSERCLVMRMLYAKKMFTLLDQGKRIINIDETWLPHLDFRNKKWRARGERIGHPLFPRVDLESVALEPPIKPRG